MEYLGFSKDAILWFKSYLSNRKFKVNLNKTFSGPEKLLPGVSHRSILGLILFLRYINDIKEIEIQVNKNFSLICD